ncbi:phosphoenolpyruvate-protein phosphotransferase PtsP [Pseudomonas sp. BAY1663]|nr:phosphoenolpyruvate-protein phosphotransferase PtsP [Pseudomonas sp. BAY1663]
MLGTLRKIVQEVNAAKDLKAALGIIVLRVREAMGSQVCSVYLLDPETERFVLMATEGLNKRAIGKVSMAPNEGLVGLVGTREEPLNLEHASEHPRYRYFAETGEERYASFLGAPIIHHRRVMGVLVIQQKERRQFDEGEEAFLVTMSAQLAGVIAHAEATGSIRGLGRQGKGIQETRFVGIPGAPGAAVGTALVVLPPADLEVVPDKTVDNIEAELTLFEAALEAVRADMRGLSEKLATQMRKEERALFDVYLMMLDDSALGGEVVKVIRTGQWAQGALRQVVNEHVRRFELMDDATCASVPRTSRTSAGACLPTCRKPASRPWSTPTRPSWSVRNCRRRCSARCRKASWSAWSRCSARATRTSPSSPAPWAFPR